MSKLFGLIVMLLVFTTPVSAADRIAWIIGNDRYADDPLKNPGRDAKAISEAFKRIGFEVFLSRNTSLSQMHKSLDSFGKKAESAKVAVIYFAGHGIQMGDKNYLVPTNITLKKDRDLRLRKLVSLDALMIEASQASELGVVMVDACRDNPFQSVLQVATDSSADSEQSSVNPGGVVRRAQNGRTRSLRGLARVNAKPVSATKRILVSLATEQGQVAFDGRGEHSPYAKALLDNIESTQDIRKILKRVEHSVRNNTGGNQVPYLYTTLDQRNYCLTQRCEDGTNGIDSDRVNQKYTPQELVQMEQAKRLKIKQEHDRKRMEHERSLREAKQAQVQKHLKHKQMLKMKQIRENKRRQERIRKQQLKLRKQQEKNRKRAHELDMQKRLQNQLRRQGHQ